MTLPELLSTLTESLSSAIDSLPALADVALPEEGLSLLSTKNELLLSYLQNLVFLIILKIRNLTPGSSASSQSASSPLLPTKDDLTDDALVVQNLVALRVYLEKGVRPLESRLRYQLDKLLLAAADESARIVSDRGSLAPIENTNGENNDDSTLSHDIDPLSHRPNPASLLGPRRSSPPTGSSSSKQGIYRPPHITPTSLPPPASHSSKKASRAAAAARKSATLDEFVREEMTDAPMAEPSIGAGSGLRGRAAERERERISYEEGRLVRLPAEKGGGTGAGAGKKRRGGVAGSEDFLLGGGGRWDHGLGFDSAGGGIRKKQKASREGSGREGQGAVIGAMWERRKQMAARGKKR
ncbi:hypothetical protein MMC07_000335 [Pseudocyphellaria aurata]|nr:hypothetical protein [Pseudocyphellaria aurata]